MDGEIQKLGRLELNQLSTIYTSEDRDDYSDDGTTFFLDRSWHRDPKVRGLNLFKFSVMQKLSALGIF